MLTETKTPIRTSLIPPPGQSLEGARDSYYGRNWPPETVGDLPGYSPSAEVAPGSHEQARKVQATRSQERARLFRKAAPYVGALVVVASVAGTEIYNLLTQPKTQEVTMTVQQYDNPSTVAQKAEARFGRDPGEFNIQQEALRLSAKYGVLHAGEQLKVFVK